jgi:hypothetical protein
MSRYSGWRCLALAVGAGTLSVALTGCGSIPPAIRSSTPVAEQHHRQQASARTGWAAYFFPPVVGYSCTLAARPITFSVAGDTITTTGIVTDTVLAVRSTAASTLYSVRSRTHVATTQTNPPASSTGISPINQDLVLDYQASSSGTLLAPEQSFHHDGIDYNFPGFIVYPSVASLQAGASRTSTVQASVSSTNPAYAAQLAAATNDHSSTLRYAVTFRVVGEPAKTIVTPAGTFTDDVGVKVSVLGMTPLNSKAGGREIQSELQTVLQLFFPTKTLYWARGVGLVEATSRGGLGDTTQLLHSCTRSGSTSSGNTGSGNTGSGNTGSGNTGSGSTSSGNTGSGNTGNTGNTG